MLINSRGYLVTFWFVRWTLLSDRAVWVRGPGRGHCIVLLNKPTLYSHSASFQPVMGTDEFNAMGVNPVID